MKTMICLKLSVALVLLLAGSAAAYDGAVGFTLNEFEASGSTQNFYSAGSASADYSGGYKFTTTKTIYVTHLGVFDWSNATVVASGDGLDVALYTIDGTPMASATVTTSDTLTTPAGKDGRNPNFNSDFLFHVLPSPVMIPAGSYVIICETVRGTVVGNKFGNIVFSNITPTPGSDLGLTYNRQWLQGGVSSAAYYPDPGSDPTKGYFGPNFIAVTNLPTIPKNGTVILVQ
jgi:hypothetical protein